MNRKNTVFFFTTPLINSGIFLHLNIFQNEKLSILYLYLYWKVYLSPNECVGVPCDLSIYATVIN